MSTRAARMRWYRRTHRGLHAATLLLISVAIAVSLPLRPAFASTSDAWEPDDSGLSPAPLLADNEAITRTLSPEGDVDWFALPVEQGRTYAIEGVAPADDPWFDVAMDVYSADSMTLLASDDDGGTGLMPKTVITAPETGELLVQVTGYSFWTTGEYSVRARVIEPAVLTGTVTGVADIGLPSAQVTVFAEDMNGWSETAHATADSSGRFTVALEPGTYRVGYAPIGSGTPSHYWNGSEDLAAAQDIPLAATQSFDLGLVQAVSWTRVTGTLTTAEPSVSLDEIAIAAYRMQNGAWRAFSWTVTDAQGHWSMSLPNGTYRFSYTEGSGTLGVIYHPNANSVELAEDMVVDADHATLSATLAPTSPSPARDAIQMISIAGSNRYDTAARIAQRAFPNGADALIVVTGTSWPDGLGAASLAGVLDAPILLVQGNDVPAVISQEARRLNVRRVVIVGGASAVGPECEDFFASLVGPGSVERIGGADRYETARLVAEAAVNESHGSWDGTFVLASGLSFPDVLAASPLAAANGWPVLLTGPTSLSSATSEFIRANSADEAIVVGGSSAVGTDVERQVERITGSPVIRLAGTDRYDTALSIATYATEQGLLGYQHLAVATGQDYPDALTCGVLQAKSESVLLLTPRSSLNADVAAVLQALSQDECQEVVFVGGAAAISSEVREQVVAHLGR